MNKPQSSHSAIKSITLHILPGLLTGLFYFLLVPVVSEWGFPSVLALIIAGVFVIVPCALGILFYHKKNTGEQFKHGIIKYLKPIPFMQYVLWTTVIVLSAGIVFTALNGFTDILKGFFYWIPEEYHLEMGLSDAYTKSKLIITYALFFVFLVIVIPIIEELYFRGYLLPRMPSEWKRYKGISHSLLFALYHTWTPWLFVTRTLAVFPLIYLVKRKENIWVGIIAHCLLNSLDFIAGVVFIMSI